MFGWLHQREEVRSVIAWGVLFLAYELCAHYKTSRWVVAGALVGAVVVCVYLWPVLTLSGTAWGGIAWWAWVGALIAVCTFVLLGHFEWHWSVRWLLGAAAASTAVIVSHALARAIHHT